jgi:hypothetical protein
MTSTEYIRELQDIVARHGGTLRLSGDECDLSFPTRESTDAAMVEVADLQRRSTLPPEMPDDFVCPDSWRHLMPASERGA